MSFDLTTVLVGAAFVIAGSIIGVWWVRSVDWRYVWDEIPNYLYTCWDAERVHLGICCVAIGVGVAVYGSIEFVEGPKHADPGPLLTLIQLAAAAAVILGGIFFFASLGDLVWHVLSGNVYEPGLKVVHEQKAHGDADYAAAFKVHTALRDDAGFETPEFED